MRDFHCSLKTLIPPLAPVKRGRGVGGEGAKHPNRHTTQHRIAPHEAAKKKQTQTGN